MTEVFNTTFEVSLRVLLTLEVAGGGQLSADRIAASDFITVYGREFGISKENLHGENTYKYGEFALRREMVKEALKELVLDAFADVEDTANGVVYSISEWGKGYASKLDNEYARRYRTLSAKVREYLAELTEREALRRINEKSLLSLQRGGLNG
jgi:ketol-acid reductoisomerase